MDNTLITGDRLATFTRNAHLVPKGIICEVGVYKGGSLKHLSELFPERLIFGFDTFEGLPPEQWSEAEHHKAGEFNDTSMEAVRNFVNSDNVTLIKGLFPDSAPSSMKKIALAHIDTDFYLSVKVCIEWFVPKMVKGGIIVFDDYQWPNCPGVKQAIDEAGLPVTVSADFQAIYIKP
jgi:O-methyltransferase